MIEEQAEYLDEAMETDYEEVEYLEESTTTEEQAKYSEETIETECKDAEDISGTNMTSVWRNDQHFPTELVEESVVNMDASMREVWLNDDVVDVECVCTTAGTTAISPDFECLFKKERKENIRLRGTACELKKSIHKSDRKSGWRLAANRKFRRKSNC